MLEEEDQKKLLDLIENVRATLNLKQNKDTINSVKVSRESLVPLYSTIESIESSTKYLKSQLDRLWERLSKEAQND
jgi:hypothetical protein